jgi:Phosphoinositide 3-kinase C2
VADVRRSGAVQVADLVPGCLLGCELWAHSDAAGKYRVGAATLPFFNKRGRLKTGLKRVKLHLGAEVDAAWPSATHGKEPLAQRGELGRLAQKVKQLQRGELPRCPWLDRKTLHAIAELETQQVWIMPGILSLVSGRRVRCTMCPCLLGKRVRCERHCCSHGRWMHAVATFGRHRLRKSC